MKNRYNDSLRDANSEILALTPANQTLRLVLAYEFAKVYKKNFRVLEIGCGEGDSILPLLEKTSASLDALDISREMINICKSRLQNYKDRVTYVCDDACDHLLQSPSYTIITTSWTVHNFLWKDKLVLLQAIYNNLPKGGWFLIMDKVYPDSGAKQKYIEQIERYRYLEGRVRKDILDHERMDFSSPYRMDEKRFFKELKRLGFKSIELIDRVERDVVILARK